MITGRIVVFYSDGEGGEAQVTFGPPPAHMAMVDFGCGDSALISRSQLRRAFDPHHCATSTTALFPCNADVTYRLTASHRNRVLL